MDKQHVVHTLFSLLKRDEILTHGTWMNPEDSMLSETSQSQKGQILFDSTYMRFIEQSNSCRQKKHNGGCQGL